MFELLCFLYKISEIFLAPGFMFDRLLYWELCDRATVTLSSYINYTVKCSFFSWFNDSQHSGDLEEIQDEVNSVQAYSMHLCFI